MAGPRFHTEITADAAQYNAEMDAAAQRTISDGQRMQSGWRESMVRIGQATTESVKGMNTTFDGLRGAISAIRGPLAILAAVVATGKFFKGMADSSAEATQKTADLARMMGITTQEASALTIALGDIGVKTDAYTGMVSKMVTKLRENEESFNRMGVATRDSNGQLLDTQVITQNALRALLEFKEGTDRNLASSAMFGRGWDEVNRLVRLTPAVMEEARRKAEELQTQVGPAGAERARVYKLAMNDIKGVVEALANRIGQAVMPIFADFGQWLSDIGPAAVLVMRGAIGGLITVFYGARNGVVMFQEVVKAMIFTVTEPLVAMGEAIALALSGKFAEAKKRLAEGDANISARWKMAMAEVLRSSEVTAERINELFDFKEEQGPKGGGEPKGTKSFEGEDKNKMAGFETELAARRDAYDQMKVAQGSFQTFSKTQERDYWAAILAIGGLTKQEEIAVLKKFYEAERDLRKTAFEAEIADLHARVEAHKQGSVERIQIAGEMAAKIGQKFGLLSPEYKKALEEMTKLAQERAKQMVELEQAGLERQRAASMSAIELERQMLDQAEALGQISAEKKLARLRQLKEQEFQTNLQAEQANAAIYELNAVQYQAHLDRIAQLKERHRLDVNKIDGQIRVQSVKVWKDIGDAISGAFSTAVKGVIMGTQTMGQAMRNMAQSVLLAMLDIGIKILAQKAVNAILGTLIEKESAVSRITANAAVAASGAAASVAAIPIYGWAMAPAVAAETFAATEAWAAAAVAAAGGFDIPRGLNPITQLHQEEMVLPANLANPLREQLADGGGMGGGNNYTINIKALDGKDVYSVLSRNSAGVARVLRELARDHTPMPRT
jgi:hypothetical protein